MNLTTNYLNLVLRTPLIASASPLSEKIDGVRRLEDSGASAIVLFSLFEEQLEAQERALDHYLSFGTESHAEALTYFPSERDYKTGPEGYLNHIRKSKAAVDIPIIASLNGSSIGGWTKFAAQIEEAGADALELNVYYIPTDFNLSGTAVEQTYIDILKAVKSVVSIPVAVKLSPYFSNMANMAKQLDDAGADALVLFNRFYQPDIDLETLEVKPNVLLSTPQALRLPLTWIGILYKHINANMAATGGVHTAEDVLKMLMVGADVTMMASALLKQGPTYLRTVEEGLRRWMEEHEYVSVAQMRGSLSQAHTEDPTAFERAQYMKALTYYRTPTT